MDVAEQALELLSRRHSKQILNVTQSGSIGVSHLHRLLLYHGSAQLAQNHGQL
jgi:hypothetical protein